MKYRNVIKEFMVKDVVIDGESKYNFVYVNYYLIFKDVFVLCLFGIVYWMKIYVIYIERYIFFICCNNWYKNELWNVK